LQKRVAFVLGAAVRRGALQVGALRALAEAGFQPDILIGASVGAGECSYLAVNGTDLAGIAGLEDAWHDMKALELAPSNYLWVSLRILLHRPTHALSSAWKNSS